MPMHAGQPATQLATDTMARAIYDEMVAAAPMIRGETPDGRWIASAAIARGVLAYLKAHHADITVVHTNGATSTQHSLSFDVDDIP
jgi:hypothetical protein